MTSELSPEAPVYIPPPLRNAATPKSSPSSTKSTPRSSPNTSGSIPSPLVKEPQCSRYSRRSVRYTSSTPNSPRPILGTKSPFPRPILGRRSDTHKDELEEYIGKEFRSMTRSFSKMKTNDEQENKEKTETTSEVGEDGDTC
ncbi:unnamed protein product [Acanthoscelides obtectus]|uniref:Uncharacterized protein n=1 Tax=Acanthoscelides obtectus TaxID=200917 RepID=A0A9P0LAL0_ACAOB|nr:unnamed protein product [Acanthoscelides obtectus]CAK1630824.1 hypothetical protein AOBTE_LOCUS6575 [Acanthoscelides obtectus]